MDIPENLQSDIDQLIPAVREQFNRCVLAILDSGIKADCIHIPEEIRILIPNLNRDQIKSNRYSIFVETRDESERIDLYNAFTNTYGALTMGEYRSLNAPEDKMLLHIDINPLNEMGVGTGAYACSNSDDDAAHARVVMLSPSSP